MSKTLKIIPGRGLSGRELKMRLRNRTMSGSSFGEESYMQDESMLAFTKMNRVQQIEAAKANAAEVRRIQSELEHAETKRQARMKEQEIERRVSEKMKSIANQQIQQQL